MVKWTMMEITSSFIENGRKKRYRKARSGWYEGKKERTQDILQVRGERRKRERIFEVYARCGEGF